jgi:very-short-patch-repair endonuclease
VSDWNAIRDFYKKWHNAILEAGRAEWADEDPYLWDHVGHIELTPIERWLWADIRQVDCVLYPQYPVAGYFVDFANPVAKVAIECDGAAYHTDKAKDAARDKRLFDLGWTVYRISGKACRTEQDEETGASSEARRFIKEIALQHAICRP